ncbi:hypothetical protein SK355_12095 (plasmid) [Candidatus Fukatsuia symbiotica]|nr:hypothetical protein [Candidatus Fukatsuia symbiotica]MEA9445916.1 hypothetical protein [Candidatus Fukatsuia symbiotica]
MSLLCRVMKVSRSTQTEAVSTPVANTGSICRSWVCSRQATVEKASAGIMLPQSATEKHLKLVYLI